MKDLMRKVILTLKIGNLTMVLDDDVVSRAKVAKNQDKLLDELEKYLDNCEEIPKK